MHIIKSFISITILAVLVGCATPVKPGITGATEKLDLGEDTLLLLTAELANDYKPSYQPEAMVLHVETPNAKDSKDRLNFLADNEGTFHFPTGNKYIFRARMKSGDYILRGITGGSGIFPVHGMFFVPLHCEISAKKGEVVDLGKIIAKTRERQGNEFRAGPVVPLIDQAVTGFAGSTFDIQMIPSTTEELQQIRTLFPILKTASIEAKPLPPFNRDVAQKWWETH